ncbi:winged helix-turn-helix transcriptional regulator, partial [Parvimonas sp. M20]|uniref:winged helix-turn-helix transcriptional regulator n=1 Tax=Parvimonas sp. M20 TaxID=3110693 RepID=UPI002B4854A7
MSTIYDKCPHVTTQKVLQGKWAIVVLYHLSKGTKRFNELERLIPEVTRTFLTRQLRQLEQYKLITRKVFAEVPPHVEYSLST